MMKEAQWVDVGIWLQTIMLLLRGEGLDSCPQEYLGLFGRTIKTHLGLSDDTLLFSGLAIGWRDPDAPVNNFARDRVPLAEQVIFQGFEIGRAHSELQSLMRISYAVFCLKKKNLHTNS